MRKKMRKQISGKFNPWNFDLEEGQRVIHSSGRVYDLYESNGHNKAAAGELSYREVKKPNSTAKAIEVGGVWYWEW